MNKSKCEFYEEDTQARIEAEEIEKAYISMIGEEAYKSEQDMLSEEEESELSGCCYCKHLVSGSGFPGEYVYSCQNPKCPHIIKVDFNESEVI